MLGGGEGGIGDLEEDREGASGSGRGRKDNIRRCDIVQVWNI